MTLIIIIIIAYSAVDNDIYPSCSCLGVCPVSVYLTKRDCRLAGHSWTGFDVSGHCFLLCWNNLFMVEEFSRSYQQVFSSQHRDQGAELRNWLKILCCFLCLLMLLGEIMLIFTSLYFHSFGEKLLGTCCGLGSWYFLYRVLYPNLRD